MESTPSSLHLITGGARSGKSRYAQQLAGQLTDAPVYVATANVDKSDTDFDQRVRRHQQERGSEWTSFEEPRYVSRLPLAGRVVIIDCVTLWLTNFFSDAKYDVDSALNLFKHEVDQLVTVPAHLLIVTNEIGMGVHAETTIGRKFTDLQGWANQYLAQRADAVTLMVCGLPLPVKQIERGSV